MCALGYRLLAPSAIHQFLYMCKFSDEVASIHPQPVIDFALHTCDTQVEKHANLQGIRSSGHQVDKPQDSCHQKRRSIGGLTTFYSSGESCKTLDFHSDSDLLTKITKTNRDGEST